MTKLKAAGRMPALTPSDSHHLGVTGGSKPTARFICAVRPGSLCIDECGKKTPASHHNGIKRWTLGLAPVSRKSYQRGVRRVLLATLALNIAVVVAKLIAGSLAGCPRASSAMRFTHRLIRSTTSLDW